MSLIFYQINLKMLFATQLWSHVVLAEELFKNIIFKNVIGAKIFYFENLKS